MLTCPYCRSEIIPPSRFEFPCPVCRQLIGVLADGPRPRLVRAAPDSRRSWEKPYLKAH